MRRELFWMVLPNSETSAVSQNVSPKTVIRHAVDLRKNNQFDVSQHFWYKNSAENLENLFREPFWHDRSKIVISTTATCQVACMHLLIIVACQVTYLARAILWQFFIELGTANPENSDICSQDVATRGPGDLSRRWQKEHLMHPVVFP